MDGSCCRNSTFTHKRRLDLRLSGEGEGADVGFSGAFAEVGTLNSELVPCCWPNSFFFKLLNLY